MKKMERNKNYELGMAKWLNTMTASKLKTIRLIKYLEDEIKHNKAIIQAEKKFQLAADKSVSDAKKDFDKYLKDTKEIKTN